jgi:protein-disulfide isomerase
MRLPERRTWNWLAAAAVAAGCVFALHAPRAAAQTQAELDRRFIEAWKQQPHVTMPVASGGAKVVIVKFNDWMCPGCKYWYEQMEPVLAKYRATPGALAYVEKDWPWNSECNAAVRQTIPGHEGACAAAAAVRIAADRGKRKEMAEWLYANQPETIAQRQTMVDRIKTKAAEMLGVKDFAAAYAAKLPGIKKDVADGMALRISSTPTYFINGARASGPDNSMFALHYVELAIQYELKK